ncbi:MAG: CotH kinase family protein [Treponema sp.]|nr:CotH kinase family protein [Treponema sp.]
MKKISMAMTAFAVALSIGMFLTGCPNGDNHTGTAGRVEGNLLILQAYASAGDAAGATHSFVELYNISDKAIDLKGVSLYYAAGHKKSDAGWDDNEDKPWERITLDGKIPAKGSFLILGRKQNTNFEGTAPASRYQIPDDYGDINDNNFILYNRAFKVALIKGNRQLTEQNPSDIDGRGTKINGYIDMIGAINTAPNKEKNNNYDKIRGFETAPARCSASEAVRRKNLTDTDNNQGVSSEFPNGTGDFDSIRYASGGGGISDARLEAIKPRNSREGAWNPFAAFADTEMLMILQIGAATDGNISHSFVELYNNTNTPVNLAGYSLQYAEGTRETALANQPNEAVKDGQWKKIDLLGTIDPQHSFLILGNKGSGQTSSTNPALSLTDGSGDMNEPFIISNRSFKVVLLNNTNLLTENVQNPFDIDGYGTKADGYVDMAGAMNTVGEDKINGYEGSPITNLNKQTGQRRKSLTDTDNNKADFTRAVYVGASQADHELMRPKNTAYGSWDPVSGRGSGSKTAPVFSHKSGLYNSQFKLTLTAPQGYKIYYSIDGSIPLPSKAKSGGPVYQYNSSITVKDRNGEPNLLATTANVPKMYTHPSDPDWRTTPYYPKAVQVPKATVIRAITVDANNKQSEVVTNTYFIGYNLDNYGNHPVMSIVTDPANLLDDDIGIYVMGRGTDRFSYNYAKKGREWEREAFLEYFDGNRKVALSTGAGIRVRGGWSRAPGQKGFNVYFREEYGINNLKDYPLIPGALHSDGKTPLTKYKNFMLRNGGNDSEYTKLRDIYIQSLVYDRNFSAQAGVPCILYLNGEYWGPYNLQEKYSDNHTEYKYGVDKNNVMSFENWELDDGVGSDWSYYNNLMYDIGLRDMSVKANYDAFCAAFDIQNYIDYFAARIYINDEDWPHNNWRLWRVRDVEPGNPYGDGKWRWQVFDTEFSMGIYSNGSVVGSDGLNCFDRIINKNKNDDRNRHFINLLKNDDFCRQFVITMMDLYNVNFDYSSNIAKLDEMAYIYRPLMDGYNERWGVAWDGWFRFDAHIDEIKSYLTDIRSKMTNDYLPQHFGRIGIAASKLADVTLYAKSGGANVSGASIKINTVNPKLVSGSWTGKYYSALPVTVTANVPNGYTFTGWTVTGGSASTPSALTTTVNFTGNAGITANYSVKSTTPP